MSLLVSRVLLLNFATRAKKNIGTRLDQKTKLDVTRQNFRYFRRIAIQCSVRPQILLYSCQVSLRYVKEKREVYLTEISVLIFQNQFQYCA